MRKPCAQLLAAAKCAKVTANKNLWRYVMKPTERQLTLGELHYLDGLISLALEQGIKFDEVMKPQSEVCCCGAIATETKGKFVFSDRDREIIAQIAKLESQIESAPTLGQMIEIRGELLREASQSR
jgi:RNase P/RNase MRP subunit p29